MKIYRKNLHVDKLFDGFYVVYFCLNYEKFHFTFLFCCREFICATKYTAYLNINVPICIWLLDYIIDLHIYSNIDTLFSHLPFPN